MFCAYCSELGHGIRQCNSPAINPLIDEMRQLHAENRYRNIFMQVMHRRYTLPKIKVVFGKLFPTERLSSVTKPSYIRKLWEHFERPYAHLELRPEELPQIPDIIPDFAQDLAEPLSPESDDSEINVSWDIVREGERTQLPANYDDSSPTTIVSVQNMTDFENRNARRPIRQQPFFELITQPNGYLFRSSGLWDNMGRRNMQDMYFSLVSRRNQATEIASARFRSDVPTIEQISLMCRDLYNESLAELNSRIDSLSINYREKYNKDIRSRQMTMNVILEQTEETEQTEECAICFESINVNSMVITGCNHEFCGKCIKDVLNHHTCINTWAKCPMCRAQMYDFKTKTKEMYDSIMEHKLVDY